MSALRSSAGPAVWTNGTSSSAATIWASEVLPRPGGPASSTWSSASPRAAAAASETPSCSLTASWPTNSSSSARAQRRVDVLVGALVRALDAVGAGRADHRRAPLSACAIRSSGVSPGAPSSSLSASCGREAEADQAVAGEHPRVVAARDHDRLVGAAPTFSRSSTTIRSAVRLPMPGAAWSRAGVAGRDRAQQVARRAAGEDGERHLRPDRLDADQQQEQVALLLGGEAVELQRVVADDQVGVDRRPRSPTRGTCRSVSAETASR